MTNPALGRFTALDQVRSFFPALEREQKETPVAYFDGPGGTQIPITVADAMRDYLLHHNANTRWAFPTSVETDAIIASARRALADFLNAAPNEIVFGANMTTLTFHLARAFGRNCQPEDEIVITELDHHANVAPWRALEEERGVVVRVAKMIPATGQLDWDDLEAQLSRRTKLLALGAASNALGTITDVSRAAQMAHSVGAMIFVDAVHYAPHMLVDVVSMDCDFLSCSAYKFYGPHIGVLYGRGDLLASLDFPKLLPAPNEAPELAETGTQNHEGIAGAAAAVNFLASLGSGVNRRARLQSAFENLHARGSALIEQMWQGLAAIDGVRKYGPASGELRTPTLAFTVDGVAPLKVARYLAEEAVFVSDGDFYASTLVERLGLAPNGLVRAGCACYTTEEEVNRLIDGVRVVARR